MILKIYLGISISTIILFMLTGMRAVHYIKKEYKDKINKDKEDKIGLFFLYIKGIIVCFIPILNIGLLIIGFYFFVICDNEKVLEMAKIDLK